MATLVVVRHAKSDWDVPADDRHRPLAARGRRQAPATGRWLAEQEYAVQLAVVSPARRARQTWELVSAELSGEVRTLVEEAAYTFDGEDLFDLVRTLPAELGCVALVGHNPAVEELVERLTGRAVPLPTSAVAVIELESWSGRSGRLVTAGRPADGPLD